MTRWKRHQMPGGCIYAKLFCCLSIWMFIAGTAGSAWAQFENEFPVACITSVIPSSPKISEQVTISGACSYDPDGVVFQYQWTFSDGQAPQTGSAASVTRTFSQAGTYAVFLQVKDNDSAWSGKIKRNMTVTANNFTVNVIPSAGCAVIAGDGGVDAVEADGIACAGGMAATNPLCTEQFKNADLAALKVVPEAGYAFTGWTVNGAEITTASAETLFLTTMPMLAGLANLLPSGTTLATVGIACPSLTFQKISNDHMITRLGRDSEIMTVRVIDNNGQGQHGVAIHFDLIEKPADATGEYFSLDDVETNAEGKAGSKLFLGHTASSIGQYRVAATASYDGKSFGEPQIFLIQGIEIVLTESSSQKYGYDEYTSSIVPYKSLETGQSDLLEFHNLLPNSLLPELELQSDVGADTTPNITVSPIKPIMLPQMMTLTGNADGEDIIQLTNSAGSTINMVSVKAYTKPLQPIDIALIHVIEENDDVQERSPGTSNGAFQPCVSAGINGARDTNSLGDDQVDGETINTGANGVCETTANATNLAGVIPNAMQIKDDLNTTVYNQAVIEWNVVRYFCPPFNYDFNRDGKLEYYSQAGLSQEAQAVISHCQYGGNNVFFTIPCSKPNIAGFAEMGKEKAFVTGNASEKIVAHELGHAAFSLSHPPGDTQNIMYEIEVGGWRLRKYQWDIIHQP